MVPVALVWMLATTLIAGSANAVGSLDVEPLATAGLQEPLDLVLADASAADEPSHPDEKTEETPEEAPIVPGVPPVETPGIPEETPETPERPPSDELVPDPEAMLECMTVVRVTLAHYTGEVTDTRLGNLDFLSLEPLQRIVRGVNSLLGGPRMVVENLPVQLAVRVQFHEDYIVFTNDPKTYHLALPIGLPLVEAGIGEIVQLCGSEVPILSADIPSWYDAHGQLFPPVDGWFIVVDSVKVSLADTPEELAFPEDASRGFSIRPIALMERVRSAIDDFRQKYERDGRRMAPVDEEPGFGVSAPDAFITHEWVAWEDEEIRGAPQTDAQTGGDGTRIESAIAPSSAPAVAPRAASAAANLGAAMAALAVACLVGCQILGGLRPRA